MLGSLAEGRDVLRDVEQGEGRVDANLAEDENTAGGFRGATHGGEGFAALPDGEDAPQLRVLKAVDEEGLDEAGIPFVLGLAVGIFEGRPVFLRNTSFENRHDHKRIFNYGYSISDPQ